MILEHAILAPSAAGLWGHCTGSLRANQHAPDIACERTRSGEASHWVGESVLGAKHTGVMACDMALGQTAPNGVVIDEEMVEGAQVYVDDVMRTFNAVTDPGGELIFIEQRVEMPHIHPDNWGTLDAALWVPAADTLYIWDYKFGHREVTAVMNLQMIDYVAGLMQLCPGANTSTTVVFRVVQPFCYHAPEPIREWTTTIQDLQFWFRHLHDKAHQALGENPTMESGVHCRDCAAIATCRTARRSTYSVVDYAAQPYLIDTLDGEDLASERHILQTGLTLVKARLAAIEDQLHLRIAEGDGSSGLTVQAGQGRLKWDAPAAQIIALGQQFGVDLSKDSAVTPTQAVKAVPAPMRSAFEGVISSITTRPSSGMKLVSIENSRTARAFRRK